MLFPARAKIYRIDDQLTCPIDEKVLDCVSMKQNVPAKVQKSNWFVKLSVLLNYQLDLLVVRATRSLGIVRTPRIAYLGSHDAMIA